MSNERSAITMLQMMATMLSEEELVDRALKALTEYKEKGCPKDDQPFPALTMVLIKWQQEEMTMKEILEDAMLRNDLIRKVRKKMETTKKNNNENIDNNVNSDGNSGDEDDIIEEEEEEDELRLTVGEDGNGNEIKVRIIPMGSGGEA